MFTPFDYPDAQVYLRELAGSDDAVVVLKRAYIAFDSAYDAAEEKHVPVPERICVEFWTACCLVDAVLNRMDYSESCQSCDTIYHQAVKKLETAFSKRIFWSFNKPVHDAPKICRRMCDELYMFDNEDNSELAANLKNTEDWEAFGKSITALISRLELKAEK